MPKLMLSIAIALGLTSTAGAQVIAPNVDDLAKELSNPGASNATQNFKFEYRTFDGTLLGANNQNSTTFSYQPVLPFKLNNGNNLIFRPAFSFSSGQPSIDPVTGSLKGLDSWGDIPYDLLYSWNTNGWTLGAGLVGLIPTGTNGSSDNWLLGPSFLATKPTDWGIYGIFPFHNEKVGGSGADTSITSLQYFLFYGLGDGWMIGTGPTMSYNWNAQSGQEWTVPLQLALSKTTSIGKRIVKLNFSVERNVVRPDTFAEDMTYTFTISPVTKNPFQKNPPSPPIDEATRAALLAPIR